MDFCLNPDTGEFVEGSDCPEGFVGAEQANRVISWTQRQEDFYCIVPDGKTLDAPPPDPLNPPNNPNSVLCTTAPDPAAHQHIDICQDVPKSCRTAPLIDPEDLTACAPEDLPDPSEPACDPNTSVGPTRYACSQIEDTAGAVGKLISAVSVYGLDVPDGDAPERYCFLSCYENIDGGCDEDLVDPPEVRTTSFTAGVDPVTSSALVSIKLSGTTYADGVAVEGKLAFDVPVACRGPLPVGESVSCQGMLSLIDLRSVGDLTLAGETLTGLGLHIPVPLPTQMRTVGSTTTIISGQSLVYVLGTIGSYGDAGAAYEVEGLQLTVDWSTGEIQALTTLEAADESSDLVLDISGPISNQPPIADAGRDQVLECGDPNPTVSLSASTSFDADGGSELASFTWSSVLDGVRRTQNGMDWTDAPVAELGTTYFTVVVGDNDAASDTDTVAISVGDTVAPTFESTHQATSCLWPPNGDLLLFELGEEIRAEASDACDGAASIEILTVTSNQPTSGGEHGNTSPDVVYGSGAFCIRAERTGAQQAARVYTVIVAATDEAGNITTRPLTVRVPYRSTDVPGCATPSSIEAVSPTDPRCSAD